MGKLDNKKMIISGVALVVVVALLFVYLTFFRTFSVYFDSKMGTSIEAQEIKKGEKAEKPADPIMDGYRFLGWYLGDEKFNFDTEIKESMTLTAKWEKITE